MKTIQRSLLISLVPLLTPLTAFAETAKKDELVSPISGTKGNADSWRASQVMGLNVKNAADETIGEVKDLVLDMKSGEVLAVIISSGGFLGVADTLSAVPVTALRYDGTTKAFKTRLTKEQLGKPRSSRPTLGLTTTRRLPWKRCVPTATRSAATWTLLTIPHRMRRR